MPAELIEDKNQLQTYRVEAIIEDGAMEVSVFTGPNALVRAENFARSYYDIVNDPQNLLT